MTNLNTSTHQKSQTTKIGEITLNDNPKLYNATLEKIFERAREELVKYPDSNKDTLEWMMEAIVAAKLLFGE